LKKRYLKWSSLLKEQYGGRVQKICLDIGAGCPHRDGLEKGGCIFCDFRGGGNGAWLDHVDLDTQISRGVQVARRRYRAEKAILYFQSYTSTNLPLDVLQARIRTALDIASQKIKVVGIALGTRPDMVPDDFLELLVNLHSEGLEVWLELGVQTTDTEGLIWLNRGHGISEVKDCLSRCENIPVLVCAHLISGIKGEKREQLLRSSLWLAERGVRALKFHPLYVLRGTDLERMFMEREYFPLSMEEYAYRVATAIKALPPGMIIQRLTADARKPWLVAPDWIIRKNEVISEIERYLD